MSCAEQLAELTRRTNVLTFRMPFKRLRPPRNSFAAICVGVATLNIAAASCAHAQSGPAPVSAPAPVRIAAPDTFTIVSKSVGERRRINVHVPSAYARSGNTRFPVLYMPDGGMDEDFPHVVKTVDSLIAARQIRPVIVVGIPNTERRRDMTGPTRIASDSAIAKRVGGSAAFRAFIRDELFPEIEKRYRTTPERSIIGESLAGLFIAETFLMQPDMFTHYVALDASMWWNAGALGDSAASFIKRADSKPRTLYLANSDIKEMGDGVRKLDRALHAAPPRNLKWTYVERLDLNHANIYLGLQTEALVHALK